jgi:flagellin
MRDLAVQAANGSVSSTEQGYLDTEHSQLATTLGQVIDQAKFNGTDLVSDSATTSLTLHTGANASETTSVSISAMTESLLKVSATTIALNGTTQTQETVNFGNISTQTSDGSGTGTYTLTLAGVTYTTASTITAATTSAAMKTALDTATDSQGNLVTTVGSFSATGGSGSDLVFTFTNNGNQTGTNSIAADHTGFNNSNITVSAGDGAGKADDAITIIDEALATVAKERATLGATQAQLESTVRNLSNVAENTAAAAGRIMDTDYAAETANLTKAQILQQAATSILAQANAQPQAVLSLLQ